MSNILLFLRDFFEIVKLSCYNEHTIERYFAKKGYRVGNGNIIFVKSLGGEPILTRIGNNCIITSGVKFITHDGGIWVLRKEKPEIHAFGKIDIKDNCFIGLNSIILPNVTIGPNSVVGAGSVVTKDVPPNSVAAGVPARVICSLEKYRTKCLKHQIPIELKGPRKDLEKQLAEYFWDKEKLHR